MNTFAQTDRFCTARFKAVLANNMAASRKTAAIALGIAFSFYLISLMSSTVNPWHGGVSFASTATDLRNLFPVTMFMSATIMASLIMHDCARKEGRISAITLPALNMEKFLSRITTTIFYGIVVALALHVVLFYTLVGLHFLFQSSEAMPRSLQPFGMVNHVIVINHQEISLGVWREIADLVIFAVFVFSCYVLGGFVWRNRSWIITSCLLLILAIIVFTAIDEIVLLCKIGTVLENVLQTAFEIVGLSLAAFNVWLSYTIFRREQIVRGLPARLKHLFRIK